MNICHENCQDICQAIAFGEDGVLATDESLWYKFDATGYTGSFRQFHGCYSAECCNAFFDIGNDATGSDHIAILELHASSASKNQSTLPTWSEASWHEASPGKHIRTAVWNNSPLSRIGTETVPLIYVKENEMALKPFPPGVFEGAVASMKRGGGIGFAAKASVARQAGAIGCLIFDNQKDGIDLIYMGLEFNGELLVLWAPASGWGFRVHCWSRTPLLDPRCEPYNLWILDVNIEFVNIGFGEHRVCEHRVCEHRVCDHRCEHRVCEHSVCEHRVCEHRVCGS